MQATTCRTWVWESKDTADLQRASTQPTVFFPIVLITLLQPSMCVVFDYYWYINWWLEDWGREGGRWVESFWLNLEPD